MHRYIPEIYFVLKFQEIHDYIPEKFLVLKCQDIHKYISEIYPVLKYQEIHEYTPEIYPVLRLYSIEKREGKCEKGIIISPPWNLVINSQTIYQSKSIVNLLV